MLITHCGAPCKMIEAYDYTGQKLWDKPWGTAGGMFAVSPNMEFIIDTGYSGYASATTIAKLDILSGDFTVIWEEKILPMVGTFVSSHPKSLPIIASLVFIEVQVKIIEAS